MDETIRQKADRESVEGSSLTHLYPLRILSMTDWGKGHYVPSDGLWDEAHSIPHEVFLPKKTAPKSNQALKLMSTTQYGEQEWVKSGVANCSLKAKSCSLPAFVNQVLLQNSPILYMMWTVAFKHKSRGE